MIPHHGRILLEGKSPDLRTAQTAMRSGIGLVARDRVGESVAPGMAIRENAFINPSATGRGVLSFLTPTREEAMARAIGTRVGLSPNDPTLAIEALSGGNQQKVVVGRWLDSGRRLLITEDPTAGVDVGAKAEIYHLLYQALASGMGVLVVSTDFEEIANICHRAIVFSRGLPVAELTGVELSTESLIQAASAGEAAEDHDARYRIQRRRAHQGRTPRAFPGAEAGPAGPDLWPCAPDAGLILVFSLLLPNTFPTLLNLRSILSDKAIIALLSLAAMIPMVAGRIDLTVGYGIVLWHILAISLQTMYGLPWPMAVAIVLILGIVVGALNGLLVEVARIDSFIATLGTGTILYALALWHTGGRQMVGQLPDAFYAINGTFVFGLPITAFYVLAVTLILWLVLDYTPTGRYLYAIGANQRAAELNGIPTRKYVIGAFVASGGLTALAGVLLASKLRIGQASWASNSCCPRWSAPSSAPRPSSRAGSTSGAPSSA